MVVNGIQVTAAPELTNEEINSVVVEEQRLWTEQNKKLGSVTLSLENNEIVVKTTEKSDIKRVRRITGYLSSLDNFNDAKREECSKRHCHVG